MQLLNFILLLLVIALLLLDKLRTLQELVLHPVLAAVEDERIDHHYEE